MLRKGSKKNPLHVRVKCEQRAREIFKICEEQGWYVHVCIVSSEPEDTSEINNNLHAYSLPNALSKIGRNECCPCGSGKKYKKCCGQD